VDTNGKLQIWVVQVVAVHLALYIWRFDKWTVKLKMSIADRLNIGISKVICLYVVILWVIYYVGEAW
jgi:hypothetical protein